MRKGLGSFTARGSVRLSDSQARVKERGGGQDMALPGEVTWHQPVWAFTDNVPVGYLSVSVREGLCRAGF